LAVEGFFMSFLGVRRVVGGSIVVTVSTVFSYVATEISVIAAFAGEYDGLRMVMLKVSASSALKAMSVIESVGFCETLIFKVQ
jgi:hypothetical protein